MRVRAAVLALVITIAIFATAVGAAYWLLGSVNVSDALSSRWFPGVIVGINAILYSVLVIVLVVRRRRSEKQAEEDDQALRSSSERFRRNLERDRL
jgi:hypothetical protein